MATFEFDKIDNIEVAGKYPDTFITSADYDGIEMTDEQLEELNSDGQLVHDLILKQRYA